MPSLRLPERSAVAAVAALVVLTASPAPAYPRPGRTEPVVVRPDSSQSPSTSSSPDVSGDGQRVAFETFARDLISGGTNGYRTFVRDFAAGTVHLSVATDGTEANAGGQYPTIFERQVTTSISADGNTVAFVSSATNLVAGDANNARDVFARDLSTGTTERISVGVDGAELAGTSVAPDVSGDGRFVAFQGPEGLYVRDREKATTRRVDLSDSGEPANFYSYSPRVSDDGRWVAFQSSASNLAQPDPSEAIYASGAAVYLHDGQTGKSVRISGPSPTTKSNGYSYTPDMSENGRYVAYWSEATDLVPGDTNNADDVFVYDRDTAVTTRVSVSSSGREGLGRSFGAAISDDGRFVAFSSAAANLVSGDTNNATDVFVHDRLLGLTERASVAANGSESGLGEASGWPAISTSGEAVAFESTAKSFGPVTTGVNTVYRRVRGPAIGFHELDITIEDGDAVLDGTVLLAGALVTEALDDPQPAPLLPLPGADIGSAQIVLRHENEDVLFRLGLPGLPGTHLSGAAGRFICFQAPCPPSTAVNAGIGYRVELTIDGIAHRLSVAHTLAVLSRCETVCVPVWEGLAGIGVTGQEAVVAVPRAALGAPGASITNVQAVSTLGDSLTDDAPILDSVRPPDGTMWVPSVQAAAASAEVPEDGVAYQTVATPAGASFAATLPDAAIPAENDRRLWVRACLGPACGPAVSRLIPGAPSPD